MKDIEWSSTLSIEVDEIDEDHHKLVDIFNILNHSLENGDSPAYLAAVLEELINCTVWHFSHEERLMLKHGYPDLENHRAIHQQLIVGAKELQQKILDAGNTISDDDVAYLERWLTEHILTEDMRLGTYLNEVM